MKNVVGLDFFVLNDKVVRTIMFGYFTENGSLVVTRSVVSFLPKGSL